MAGLMIAGTETGLLRVIDVERPREVKLVSTAHGQDRSRGVLALASGASGRFWCGRKNGDLETWEQVEDAALE